MKEIKFRDLLPSEIDVRVGSTKKGNDGKTVIGFQLLLYKNQRVDTTILDETFGVFGWKNNYYQVKDTMICSISVWDSEKQQWVNKDNGGDNDFQTEQVKGECSDAFKRSAFNLGIGKKLYESPFVWINVDENNNQFSRFSVMEIDYDEKKITKLFIKNDKTGQVVFTCGGKAKSVPSVPKSDTKPNIEEMSMNYTSALDEPKPSNREEDKKTIDNYINTLTMEKYEQFKDYLVKRFNKDNIKDLNDIEYHKLAETIRK